MGGRYTDAVVLLALGTIVAFLWAMAAKGFSIFLLGLAFFLGGCSGDKEVPFAEKPESLASVSKADSSNRVAFPKERTTGLILGRVTFDGRVPKAKRITVRGDAVCETAHPGGMTPSEVLLVSKDRRIQNVFVYIKQGTEGWDFVIPSEPVMVDQKNCLYVPHVLGVMAGQPVAIKSSDATTHNVHFVGRMNTEFNMTQKQGQTDQKMFSRREVMARFKCDIHPWMGAYVGILYHPFYEVTGPSGEFHLGKLPAGEYVVEAWHESLGTQTETVTVGEGETKSLDFKFSKS